MSFGSCGHGIAELLSEEVGVGASVSNWAGEVRCSAIKRISVGERGLSVFDPNMSQICHLLELPLAPMAYGPFVSEHRPGFLLR